nr:unnamed protein product [Callosobruchus chinensis]
MEDVFKNPISSTSFYGRKKYTLPPNPDISDGSDTSDEETEIVRVMETQNTPLDSVSENDGPIVTLQPSTSQGKRRKAEVTFHWTKDDLPPDDQFFETRDGFRPITNEELLSPLEYFMKFFCMNIIQNIVDQTNLYSTQVRGQSIATNTKEITDFLSIMLRMGIVRLPSYEDYWSLDSRIADVADLMSIKRFKLLRRFIHFNDNSLVTQETKDRFFKVRPLIEKIRENCQKFHIENDFSIDETMVATKGLVLGTYASISKTSHTNGVFVIAGVSGIILDTLPDPANSVVYFDNYFSGLPLFNYLKHNMNIRSLGTLRLIE